jgi:hypothetical protein
MIFITLPVTDMFRARAFYKAPGFSLNEKFSGPTSAGVVVSETIYLMLSTHDQFRQFSPKPLVLPSEGATCLFALPCDSRAEVDAMTDAAIMAGGGEPHPAEDLGFMYSRAFSDPDGDAFGPFWVDPAAAEGPPKADP